MLDSGLVRGVTLFLLSKVPGPRFTSCDKEFNGLEAPWGRGEGKRGRNWISNSPLVCLCGCSQPPRSDKWTPLCIRRPLGWASEPCAADTSGRASRLEADRREEEEISRVFGATGQHGGRLGDVVPTCAFVQEVRKQAAHDGLVADNQDVLLQLHDDRLHALHQVLIGLQSGNRSTLHQRRVRPSLELCPGGLLVCVYLAGRVAVVVFVFISQSKLLWELLLHLVISHLFTHALFAPKERRSAFKSMQGAATIRIFFFFISQRLSRSGPSIVRTGLPNARQSGWCCTAGWSKPSGLWAPAPSWTEPDPQKTAAENKQASLLKADPRDRSPQAHSLASHLSAPRRKACVTSQTPLQVVSALAVPTQVDGPGLDVNVHQVVDDLALDVVLDAVDEVPASHVDHLDKRQFPGRREQMDECGGDVPPADDTRLWWIPVVLVRVQRLVAGSVALDSLLEIQHGVGLVAVAVVWARHLHFLQKPGGGC